MNLNHNIVVKKLQKNTSFHRADQKSSLKKIPKLNVSEDIFQKGTWDGEVSRSKSFIILYWDINRSNKVISKIKHPKSYLYTFIFMFSG